MSFKDIVGHSMELGDLLSYLKKEHDITYKEAESRLPHHLFEDGFISVFSDYEFLKPIVENMILEGITSIRIYQDC